MSTLDSSAFEKDLAAALKSVSDVCPDYVVPVPRKTAKIFKLYPRVVADVHRKTTYTTSFNWSPQLAELHGKRVALIDDATLRGITLKRHRTRFEERQADVMTFAVYKCHQPPLPDAAAESTQPFPPDRHTIITRNVSLEEYRAYHHLLRVTLRSVNPLLEYDHLHAGLTVQTDQTAPDLAFIDLAGSLGRCVTYPYNMIGPVLGVTIIEPFGGDGVRRLAVPDGRFGVLSKIRAYYDLRTSRLTLVPMVFPDIELAPFAFDAPYVWKFLQSQAREHCSLKVPGWTDARTNMHQPDRLVYELVCYLLGAVLLSDSLKDSTFFAVLEACGVSTSALEIDSCDHAMRFGPELGGFVSAATRNADIARLVARELIADFSLAATLPLGVATHTPANAVQTPSANGTPELFRLCVNIVEELKRKFLEQPRPTVRPFDDRQGWTYSQLANRMQTDELQLVSEAVDYLCDNGYIVPWYSPPDAISPFAGRYYRSAEYTELPVGFDAALDLVGFVVQKGRNTVRTMHDGVPVTMLNKLITNILIDLETFLSREDVERLEAIGPSPGLHGPEIMIRHLLDQLQASTVGRSHEVWLRA